MTYYGFSDVKIVPRQKSGGRGDLCFIQARINTVRGISLGILNENLSLDCLTNSLIFSDKGFVSSGIS